MTDQIKYKVLLIGDMAVGKTCFLVRFCDGSFTEGHISTIGVDYKSKFIKYKDQDIKLEIWDTAGQERFKCITKNYFKGSDGIIIFYDVTRRETFNSIKSWVNSIKDQVGLNEVSIIIVGNKCDSEELRAVKKEEGIKYCAKSNIDFIESSGKANVNVNETVSKLLDSMILKTPKDAKNKNTKNIKRDVKQDKEKKDCCIK